MAIKQDIGAYSAYAIAVKYGYGGTEAQWVAAQEKARKDSEAAAEAAKSAQAEAEKARDQAQTAKANAETAQGAAANSTQTAQEAATTATQQAQAAQAAKIGAEAAETGAEAARTGAETAQAGAKAAQGAAANSAQTAQEAATTATQQAQAAQESATELAALLFNNAGAHNAIYRGKNLGTSVTAAQWAAIANGTFADLYIGDYWVIGSINWRIAAFDYYYKTGDTSCATHHVVIVPDTLLYVHVMNDTNITTGGYIGSKMYTEGLAQAKTQINSAFGASHILSHRQMLVNAVTNGKPSGGSWYDSTVEIMAEQNVYGGKIFGAGNDGSTVPYLYTFDKSQFPLFAHDPSMISNRQGFWLRDVVSAAGFARVSGDGHAYSSGASAGTGVRPAFSIKS